ncbi:MAG: hypothetical protein IIA61_05635 [Candidatus Marinimicrobia bacterium]|nr:hypothetical protein [Candidatus Neomarinimicrobiota bacterium]
MLFLESAPISIGMLSTFLFQVIDTYFVGQLGSQELAALSFSSIIFFLLIALFIGMSVGVSSVVTKSIGENKPEKDKSFSILALFFVLTFSVVLSLIGYLTINPLFSLLGVEADILALISDNI